MKDDPFKEPTTVEEAAENLRRVLDMYESECAEYKRLKEQTEQKRERCTFLAGAKDKASADLYKLAVGTDRAKANILMFG